MTLQDAAEKFTVPGLIAEQLKGQEPAFQSCISFLRGIRKTKRQNMDRTTYGLKHMVESPARYIDSPTDHPGPGYVYEGTFLLAAFASGFTPKPLGKGITSTLNISSRDLRRRLLEVVRR